MRLLFHVIIAGLTFAPALYADSPEMYRITADVLIAEEINSLEYGAGVSTKLSPNVTLFDGPEVALDAVRRQTKETRQSRRFITTVPGHPARISATERIPYVRNRFIPTRFGGFVSSEADYIEVGAILRVTVVPAGPGRSSVSVSIIESEIETPSSIHTPVINDSRIVALPALLPPQTRSHEIVTNVIVPLGSTIAIGGIPATSDRKTAEAGAGGDIRTERRAGGLHGRWTDTHRDLDSLILLTVTEARPISGQSADELIEQFFNKKF